MSDGCSWKSRIPAELGNKMCLLLLIMKKKKKKEEGEEEEEIIVPTAVFSSDT